MAAGQRDIPVLLQPGSGATVRAPGEFMYLAFADREILAIVTGLDGTQSRLKMVTGDFTKPSGGIEEVELVNPDPDNACAVTVIIGAGEFDRKIIQGEVTITPGIRGADGQFVDDTRSTVRLRVAIGNIDQRSYTAGQQINTLPTENRSVVPTALDDGRVLTCDTDGDFWRLWDWPAGIVDSIIGLGDGSGCQVGPLLYVPAGESIPGLGGRIVLNVYDAATLQQREKIVTGATWGGTGGNPQIRSLVSLPGGRFAVAHNNGGATQDSNGTTIIDGEGALLATLDAYGRSLIVRGGVLYVISDYIRDQSMTLFDAVTLAELPISRNQLPEWSNFTAGAVLTSRDTIILASGNAEVTEIALTDITITASGSVTSCAGGGFLKSSPIETQAEIYTQRLDDGRVLMSGEILRAALEIYTGRYMPANYLDYVYRVRAENLNGISPRTVDSGGKSFLAAGIPDDASGTFPQTLEITLREGLL